MSTRMCEALYLVIAKVSWVLTVFELEPFIRKTFLQQGLQHMYLPAVQLMGKFTEEEMR